MLSFFVLASVVYISWIRRDLQKAEQARDATFADCDADDALLRWYAANHGRYIADVPKGRPKYWKKKSTRMTDFWKRMDLLTQ